MTEENKPLSEEEIKKQAYSLALRLKHSGLDSEIIYARLEKQGIPQELAKKVVKDLMTQKTVEAKKEKKSMDNVNAILIGIIICATIASFTLNVGFRIIPYGVIIAALISIFARRKKS